MLTRQLPGRLLERCGVRKRVKRSAVALWGIVAAVLIFTDVVSAQAGSEDTPRNRQALSVYLGSRANMSRDRPVVVLCTQSPALAALSDEEMQALGRGTAVRVVKLDECVNLDQIRRQTDSPHWLLILRDFTVADGRISITGFGVSPVSTWREDVTFDPAASPVFVIRLSDFST
jgi:hypothetical protein